MAYGKAGRPKKEGWLSVKMAADALGVPYGGFLNSVLRGAIPSIPHGTRRLVSILTIEQMKKQGFIGGEVIGYKEKAEYPEGRIPTTCTRIM